MFAKSELAQWPSFSMVCVSYLREMGKKNRCGQQNKEDACVPIALLVLGAKYA